MTLHPLLEMSAQDACPIWLSTAAAWPAFAQSLPASAQAFAQAHGFKAEAGSYMALPDGDGRIFGVALGLPADVSGPADLFMPGKMASILPAGLYRYVDAGADLSAAALHVATLAFLLDAYRFDKYRKPSPAKARLVLDEQVDGEAVTREAEGVELARDLINTPASDLGPEAMEATVRALGVRHGAAVTTIVGDDLIQQGLAMIHAVGRAASEAPRLIDLTWGREDAPRVTLVGKGVCFDTGGLNIKPDSAMLLMKKDMGGAAAALGAAHMIMSAGLDVRLRVLVPSVENSISAGAFRPGDVLHSKKGLTVEIGNTDAEGRLILADALALADQDEPDLMIDYATLTGAARVALGPDLPALFTRSDMLADEVATLGLAINDPVWRLPLWKPYARMLDSKIADINHVSSGGLAGAITAALFLDRFVEKAGSYAHLDLYAWNQSSRPGRPEGGEGQCARLTYALVKARYGA